MLQGCHKCATSVLQGCYLVQQDYVCFIPQRCAAVVGVRGGNRCSRHEVGIRGSAEVSEANTTLCHQVLQE
jgi:hypothetical protein